MDGDAPATAENTIPDSAVETEENAQAYDNLAIPEVQTTDAPESDEAPEHEAGSDADGSAAAADTSESDTAATDGGEDGERQPSKEASDGDGSTEQEPGNKRSWRSKYRRQTRKLQEKDDEIAALKAQLAERQQGGAATDNQSDTSDTLQEPQQEDFDTYDAYLDARVEWVQDKRERERGVTPGPDAQPAAPEVSPLYQAVTDVISEGKEVHSDFEDKVTAEDLPMTEGMLEAMLDAEDPMELLYHIASDKDLATELSKLEGNDLVRRVGMIEAAVGRPAEGGDETPPEPPPVVTKPSSAPAPIEPVSGEDATTRDIESIPMDEYYSKRRQQERSRGIY